VKYLDFTEMPVWKLGLEILLKVYQFTKIYPKEEKYGLISDMRRAANSIPHNIAEGFGRAEPRDKSRFYKISRGSAFKLISQIRVSEKLQYLDAEIGNNVENKIRNLIKELNFLIKSIESKPKSQPQP